MNREQLRALLLLDGDSPNGEGIEKIYMVGDHAFRIKFTKHTGTLYLYSRATIHT